MSRSAVVIVYCFTIAAVSAQIFDELLLTGNYLSPQYYNRDDVQFNYGPGSTLGGPARRIATPIVEEGTEPPVYFPPHQAAVQLDRKTAPPQQNSVYPDPIRFTYI